MASTPFNLDALAVEAKGEPFTFVFGGETYTTPHVIDIRMTTLLLAGNYAGAMRMLVGEDQWARIEAATEILDVTMADALIRAWSEHIGSDPGKSRASRRSSRPTAKRSKPTSNGSIK